ncbi:MFS transporter [Microbacterium sp. LMI12-1-1.1]|uniref:MFS transporter n=1 Tax=Microbacterium sp. LMI12-1-1.1 TaxID=3135225 RepID=UPI00342DD68B
MSGVSAAASKAPAGGDLVRFAFPRLSLMMLLQYLVMGSWYATLGLVLVENGLGSVVGTVYSLAALAGIISPMFVGALADRFLPAQHVFGVLQLLGGAVLFLVPLSITGGRGELVVGIVFVYMLLFQPTFALSNSITFAHLKDSNKFPYVRVFGTVGWIVAGLLVGQLGLSSSVNLFYIAAGGSVLLGLYSFTLPRTPPTQRGVKFRIGDVVGIQALRLFRHRSFTIFAICALLTFVPVSMYNSYTSAFLASIGIENVATVLIIGQVSELLFIPVIPWVLSRVGMKWALLIGMASWGVRFALFMVATGGEIWWAIAAVALHGICNDFFLIIGFMFAEQVAPPAIKTQAQAFVGVLTTGVGVVIGSAIGGAIYNATIGAQGADASVSAWNSLFIVPVIISVVVTIIFALFFRFQSPETPAEHFDIGGVEEATP